MGLRRDEVMQERKIMESVRMVTTVEVEES